MRLSVHLFSVCVWRELCIPEWLRVSSGHDVFEMERTIHRELREADEAEFRDRVRLSTALGFDTEIKTLPSETDKEDISVNRCTGLQQERWEKLQLVVKKQSCRQKLSKNQPKHLNN